ncbi:hypothetical protein QE152_g27624 [Popillia japonica]|uniref:Apical junction molecule ajm1 alpha/beta domain-containing protein n=1 Tax=Popillia japonica TaxID=7064 RepID=A0AAW1JU61_POPJA
MSLFAMRQDRYSLDGGRSSLQELSQLHLHLLFEGLPPGSLGEAQEELPLLESRLAVSASHSFRACRRAHWEKHRKSCLFSRVGSLCRQVIASAKEKPETLHHLSVIARRGYLSHGLGAVKCFFPTPEAAEKFLTGGLENLGELTYICWKDLLPSEMGSQLYTELVKMCKHYNPDSKLVVYVSVCVVSEAPAAGAVKWERQLVSRCAKMRLSKDIRIPERDTEAPETLILTSEPIKLDPVNRYREISFGNIQRHLRQRGVSLRRHYPEVFQQLQTYVEGQCDKFKAVTVYPRDTVTGKTFICIIMPESEPENLQKVIRAGVKKGVEITVGRPAKTTSSDRRTMDVSVKTIIDV